MQTSIVVKKDNKPHFEIHLCHFYWSHKESIELTNTGEPKKETRGIRGFFLFWLGGPCDVRCLAGVYTIHLHTIHHPFFQLTQFSVSGYIEVFCIL